MSHILVTGGAGFVGSHVAEELIRRGHRVVILDDMSGGFADNIPTGAELWCQFLHWNRFFAMGTEFSDKALCNDGIDRCREKK